MKKALIRASTTIVIILLLVVTTTWAQKPDALSSLNGFDAFANKILAEWKVPGVSAAIVIDGKLIYGEGFGFKDVKNGLKVTPHTVFAIGSCTKAFTATTMGILVDEGKLDWDKPVRTYLPSFKLLDPVASEQMTPRDLVCHRSGLPRHDRVWYLSPLSREQLFERLQYLEPSRGFRAAYQYQNLMFMTAGYLVEKTVGMPWEEFARKRILEPLEMKETNFSVTDSQKAPDFALPYQEIKGKVEQIPFCNIDAIGPAGSINSNVSDMAKWVLLNLNKGQYGEKDNQRIIAESTMAQIHSPQMVVPDEMKYDELFFPSYGMGWRITAYRGHWLVYHHGAIDGFSAMVSFMPRDHFGIVLLNNLDGAPANTVLAYNIYDRLLGLSQVDWNQRIKDERAKSQQDAEKAKKEQERDRKPNTQPSHVLDDYAGDFENPGYGIVTIEKQGNELKAKYNTLAFGLKHYHYDIFDMTSDFINFDQLLSFMTGAKGQVGSLSVKFEPNAKEIIFTRVHPKNK
jgi:CubicO group peptidase (beta-lactamase class C family)